MQNEKKYLMATVVFYGALWGFLEATLGWVLHFLPSAISGIVMFPLGVFFMFKGSKVRNKSADILIVGVVAALIKLVNFFMPGLPYFKTLNPAISILLEALMVFAAIAVFDFQKKKVQIPFFAFTATFGWRIVFLIYLAAFHSFTQIPTGFFLYSPAFVIQTPALNFALVNGLFEMIIVSMMLFALQSIKLPQMKPFRIKPSVAYATIAMGIVAQILL